jgi:hypothetical protein
MRQTSILLASASFLFVFAGCHTSPPSVMSTLPDPLEACSVLQTFKGEYSYGGWGLGAESNDGELAVWTIYHSPGAVPRLAQVFHNSGPSGQAYALAALYRLDKAAFQSLTNNFCQQSGDICVGSGCSGWSETRAGLVLKMQNRNSVFAFDPAHPPRRELTFRGDQRDVYEESRRFKQERTSEAERGLAALQRRELCLFTNLFRVEDATESENGSIGGVYFDAPEWSANLLPKESFAFKAMVEVVFPKSNDVVQVGLAGGGLSKVLKAMSAARFLRVLDRESKVTGVRLRAAGERFHWDSGRVIKIESALKTGVPLRNWAQVIIDVGTKSREYVEIFHPLETDIYVITGGLKACEDWRKQYRRLTGKSPSDFPHVRFGKDSNSPHYPVVNGTGQLRLVPSNEGV